MKCGNLVEIFLWPHLAVKELRWSKTVLAVSHYFNPAHGVWILANEMYIFLLDNNYQAKKCTSHFWSYSLIIKL